jgi:hypothetical protein
MRYRPTLIVAGIAAMALGCGARAAGPHSDSRAPRPVSATPPDAKAAPPAAAASNPEAAGSSTGEAAAEAPQSRLAGIDVFGTTLPRDEVLAALDFEIGAPVTFPSDAFRAEVEAGEARLRERFDFAFVKISVISYFAGPNAGKVYLTVDIVDRGDEARMAFSPEPQQETGDPAGLIAAWMEYEARAWELVRAGALDLSNGGQCRGGFHCGLGFGHPDLAAAEDRFIAGVPAHFAALRGVLTQNADPEKRAAAAFLLAYASTREQAVEAVIPGVRDPSSLVRNNALRVMVVAQEKADRAILPLDLLLEALRYPQTTDRNKAAYAIRNTVRVAPDQYRARVLAAAGDTLLEMAAMQQPNNRDPALDILRALSGQDHGNDIAAWRQWVEQARNQKRPGKASPPKK